MLKYGPTLSPFIGESNLKSERYSMTTQLVTIGSTQIPVVLYQDQPVVTFAMIDKVHQRPEGTASRNFRSNRERFTDGQHFYPIDSKGVDVLRRQFPSVFGANATQVTLITERGYLKLVKTFTDDLAWDCLLYTSRCV